MTTLRLTTTPSAELVTTTGGRLSSGGLTTTTTLRAGGGVVAGAAVATRRVGRVDAARRRRSGPIVDRDLRRRGRGDGRRRDGRLRAAGASTDGRHRNERRPIAQLDLLAARREEALDARVVHAVLELLDHGLVQPLHEQPHGVLGRVGLVLVLLRREDRPADEQVREQTGVLRPRVLGLHVEDVTVELDVVVVAEDRATHGLRHGRGHEQYIAICSDSP